MEKVHERELVLAQLGEVLADRTLRIDQRHTFEYFQAYFMKLANRKEYLNRLYEAQKQRIAGLSYREMYSLFQEMYEAVKQRRKVIFPRKKAYYRKVRFRATWTPCIIQCDENFLSICKDQNGTEQCKQLDISHVTVSKGVIKNGDYYEFQIIYHRKEYRISFQLEYYCGSLHEKLVNLIQLKKMESLAIMDYQSKRAFYFQHARKKGLKELVVDRKEGTEKEVFRIRTAKYANRWPLSQVLQEKIRQFKELNQMEYSLVKNIANGNINRCKKSNHLKLNLIIPKVSIEVAIETYLQFQEWNSQVQTFSIGQPLEQNTYHAYVKMKQYNLLTYQRQTHLRLTFVQELTSDNYLSASFNESDDFYRHKNKYYLFIASQTHHTDSSNTRFTINQLIEFSELSDTTIFMTVIHELDFNSYRIIASNFDVSMAFFKDIEFINNLCTENMFQRKKLGLSHSRGSKIIESSSKISGSRYSIEQIQLPKMGKVNTLTTTTEANIRFDSSPNNPQMQQLQP